MNPSIEEDYELFSGAVLAVTSSLDLSNALRALYDFIRPHFPIVGLTLQQFVPGMNALNLLFLVTKDAYIYLDELISLPQEGIRKVEEHQGEKYILNAPFCMERIVSGRINKRLSPHLPFKNRAFLVAILSTGNHVIGQFLLVGKKTDCFTDAHAHKLNLLVPPVSMAMMNLLKYKQTLELQKRLDSERRILAGEVTRLKDTSIIGDHGGLMETMKMVRQLAGSELPVLILGETGTGKELIADAIQRISSRAEGPYIKVNCGAISETLVDSELFGYQKGAFTGAHADRIGRFEQADGGTLFLDEIGDLPLQIQGRLLRVLQNGVMERLGSNRPIPVNVRIIAATNRPLKAMLKQGTFREDLYYRLNAFPVSIPPLRERTGDLPQLIYHFIEKACKKMNLSHMPKLAPGTIGDLEAYSWPGNVRELENLVERAMTLNPEGPLRLHQFLPGDPVRLIKQNGGDSLKEMVAQQVEAALDVRMKNIEMTVSCQREGKKEVPLQTLDEAMAQHIRMALDQCRGKVHGPGGAAELLNIHSSTLRKRMDKLKIVYGYKR